MGATHSEQPWTMQCLPLELNRCDGGGCGGGCVGQGGGTGKDDDNEIIDGCGRANECGEGVVSLDEAEAIDCDEEDNAVTAIVDALELKQPCFIGRQFEHGWSLFTHAHVLQRAWIPLYEQQTPTPVDGLAAIF